MTASPSWAWRGPPPRSAPPGCTCPACAGAGSSRTPTRRPGRPRGPTTARRSPRRPSSGRTCWSWCAAGSCRAAGTSGWPAGWWPTRWPTSSRSPSGWGSGSAWRRCTRCSARAGACCPGSATRSTWRGRSRRRSSGSWSTPTTCGGTPSWPARSPTPAAGSPASSSPTGSSRSRPTRCSAAATSATDASTWRRSRPRSWRRATAATPRWRSSASRCGTHRPTTPRPPSGGGSASCSAVA